MGKSNFNTFVKYLTVMKVPNDPNFKEIIDLK